LVLVPIAVALAVALVFVLRGGPIGGGPDTMPRWVGLVAILAGGFGITCATFDWDWFMLAPKARFWVRILGRTGTRWFYGLLGSAFVVAGLLVAAGVLTLQR
jgi:Immunity protein 17